VRHVSVADRKGQRVRDNTFHIQNVNAPHTRFKDFVKPFDGPAKKFLDRYVAWFMFRDKHRGNRSAPDILLRYVLNGSECQPV
jgi:hypothetical protein